MSYQLGSDGQLYEDDNGALYFGVSGRYGTADSHVAPAFGHGSIDTSPWRLQGSMNWYGDDGFYVDAQTQASLYHNDLFSKTTNSGIASDVHGSGYAASLEAGRQFDINETWSLTPQAQLAWSKVSFSDFTDAYQSRVSGKGDNSLRLRLGLGADYRNAWTTVAGTPIKADLYGIANLYQDFAGDGAIAVSDVALKIRNDRTWGGIGFGGTFAWDNQYALYRQGSVNSSLNHFGSSTAIAGTIGFRKWW
nr:autotransporter outer membrane beta-barrel domain-containing protein [Brucella pituitosa]